MIQDITDGKSTSSPSPLTSFPRQNTSIGCRNIYQGIPLSITRRTLRPQKKLQIQMRFSENDHNGIFSSSELSAFEVCTATSTLLKKSKNVNSFSKLLP
ncbi:hypothetical protein L873DRAFT_1806768 [Choiromyces venosus 120613-1]|uniref:Uncharacterized protein n=1 Tax=Choiromyces venosus 120613-1 TaxID=1336337 RepID=A0A3N4K035_9PEZI|nr:hypothetical protein L873DRAFT_1806768 [Choiromyces venosus 120613-1]